MHDPQHGARQEEEQSGASPVLEWQGRNIPDMLAMIVVALLLLAVIVSWPVWPYSRRWGYMPSGTLGVALVFALVLVVVEGM